MTTRRTDVAHLLRRAGFGGTAKTVNKLAQKSWVDVVEHVLDTSVNEPIPDLLALEDRHKSEYDRSVAAVKLWFDRMARVPAPIQEKMALFWHGHFCSSQEKVFLMAHLWDQNLLFREHGMGSFEDLANAMSVQPAMLIYLDNWLNVVGVPQENFARELMELFTLGPGNYSQDDVISSARAWTGWGLDAEMAKLEFHRGMHDDTDKTFMGVTKNWSGPDVIARILHGPTRAIAAAFLVRKLWSFFAYPDPEQNVVDDLVGVFITSGLDIKSLLRAIFLRPEFLAPQARGALVRSPIEYIVATMVYTGLPARDVHPEWWMDGMGQSTFYPPNVSGWRQNSYWISSSAYWSRAAFARYVTWQAQHTKFLAGTTRLTVPDAVSAAFSSVYIDVPSATTRAALEAFVTAERTAGGWAERPNLTTLILLSPELQLA